MLRLLAADVAQSSANSMSHTLARVGKRHSRRVLLPQP